MIICLNIKSLYCLEYLCNISVSNAVSFICLLFFQGQPVLTPTFFSINDLKNVFFIIKWIQPLLPLECNDTKDFVPLVLKSL